MPRYDFKRLRRENKITQGEICAAVGITQGFFSSVENGRNLFPEAKVDKLKESFPDINFEQYRLPNDMRGNTIGSFNVDSDIKINESESLTKVVKALSEIMLNKKENSSDSTKDTGADTGQERAIEMDRLERLESENEKLRTDLMRYLDKISSMQEDIFMLKTILLDNGINFKRAVEEYQQQK